jgi:hypothetical protein
MKKTAGLAYRLMLRLSRKKFNNQKPTTTNQRIKRM